MQETRLLKYNNMEKKKEKKTLQNFTPKKVEVKPTEFKEGEVTEKFKQLLTLKGAEYEKIFKEIEGSINETGRTLLRDRNLELIKKELFNFVKTNQLGLPTVSQLSLKTSLSRVTVGKYLKEFMSAELEEERKINHKALFDIILTNIGRKAINGDMKSAKLYMETVIKLEEKDSIKMYVENQQNNIVMSNGK